MIEKLLAALKGLANPKKWLITLVSEKAAGTVLRHGLNALGTLLTTLCGIKPEVVEQWVNINVSVGVGVAMVITAYIASRLPTKS